MWSLPTGMIWEVRGREAEKPGLTSLLQAAAILTEARASRTQFFFFFFVEVKSGQVYSGLFSQSLSQSDENCL